jgi:hypothetical protein
MRLQTAASPDPLCCSNSGSFNAPTNNNILNDDGILDDNSSGNSLIIAGGNPTLNAAGGQAGGNTQTGTVNGGAAGTGTGTPSNLNSCCYHCIRPNHLSCCTEHIKACMHGPLSLRVYFIRRHSILDCDFPNPGGGGSNVAPGGEINAGGNPTLTVSGSDNELQIKGGQQGAIERGSYHVVHIHKIFL